MDHTVMLATIYWSACHCGTGVGDHVGHEHRRIVSLRIRPRRALDPWSSTASIECSFRTLFDGYSLQGIAPVLVPLRTSNEAFLLPTRSSGRGQGALDCAHGIAPQFHRARFCERKGDPAPPSHSFTAPERPFEKVLVSAACCSDIRPQIARAGSPVVFRVADAAGKRDKLLRIRRREHKIFGVSLTMRNPSTNIRVKM